jgi:hypothetical protein
MIGLIPFFEILLVFQCGQSPISKKIVIERERRSKALRLKYKEGRVPLEGPFVKDIPQDHKSSGKFSSRLSSDHEWRTLI